MKDIESERIYSVYKHTSPSNKVYIGITSMNPPDKRWKNGLGYYQNKHFYSAIQKYGWDNFKHEILFVDLTKQEAEEKEVELIALYNATNRENGYNKDNGGTSVGRLTDEQKRRLSEIGKERMKDKENNPMYGKHHSDEAKRKIRAARTGTHLSEEVKEKISKSHSGIKNYLYGKHLSEETKRKISANSKSGTEEVKRKIGDAAKDRFRNKENHPMYGKHHSEETKKKLSEHNKKLFKDPTKNPNYGNTKKIIDLDTKIIYESAYEASDKFGISVDSIRANCRGDIRTCGKSLHRFMYLKDWEEQGEESVNKEFFEYVYPSSISVRCVELDKIYASATVAGKELGIDNSTITKCCKGRKYSKTAGKLPDGTKLHWEYVS